MFYKKGDLRNLTKFTGKHLCQSLFLIKLQAWGLQLYYKWDLNTGVFCEFCEVSKNIFFKEHLWTTASECWQHFRVAFKTVQSCTILNALNPTFNFILRKFTLNSLLEKNSVFQNHFIGNKASEIKKYIYFYNFLFKLYFIFFASFAYWKF